MSNEEALPSVQETSIKRLVVGPLNIRLHSSAVHRILKMIICAMDHEYEPYCKPHQGQTCLDNSYSFSLTSFVTCKNQPPFALDFQLSLIWAFILVNFFPMCLHVFVYVLFGCLWEANLDITRANNSYIHVGNQGDQELYLSSENHHKTHHTLTGHFIW